jgi:adenosylcobinamide-GDP ribazoletransferase
VFAILKDSRIGSYGATALVLSLLLRAALIARLGGAAAGALLLVGAASRLAPVWLMSVLPYVTPDDVARSGAVARTGRVQAVCGTVLTAAIAVALVCTDLVSRSSVLLCAPVALATAALLGWRFFRRVGGVTGDLLGATQQLTECALLLTLASS